MVSGHVKCCVGGRENITSERGNRQKWGFKPNRVGSVYVLATLRVTAMSKRGCKWKDDGQNNFWC